MTTTKLPPKFDQCFDAETWERLIKASAGSPRMKARVIAAIDEHVREPGSPYLNCFKVGYALGAMSRGYAGEEQADFLRTIESARDLNKLPIVRVDEEDVH
jgi:hypothetical protein